MEIERKFLVSRLPDALEGYPRERMEQAYISTDPLIRIRRAGERYILTCKGRGLLSRDEFEMEITPEAYNRLLTKADGLRIIKDRYRIPLGAYTAELDIFAPPLTPLAFAEVEFPTLDAAQAFAPPDWFGREVTHNPAYTNAALSQNGVPEEKYDPQDLKSVLVYVRNQFGAGAFEEPLRIVALLLDLAPDLKREGNVLRQMSDAGLLRELRTASESGAEYDCARTVAKSRKWLIDYLMLSDEKADYFMTALQAAYGLVITPPQPVAPYKPAPTPQAVAQPKPTPQPVPTPAPKPQPWWRMPYKAAPQPVAPYKAAPQPVAQSKAAILDSGATGDCTWTLDSNQVLTISGRGRMGRYNGKYDVIPWRMDKQNIKAIVIEHGVTSIGDSAFEGCAGLTSVTIPDSVTSIETFAFRYCKGLTSVMIPDSVTSIGNFAFDGCSGLTSVRIPDRATVGDYAFDDCGGLKQVSVSKKARIASNAFDRRTKVTRR